MKKLLLLLLIVGCKNTVSPDADIHPLVGIWIGIERQFYSVNQFDTSTVMIDTTGANWTFNSNNSFLGWNETSYDTLFYSGSWQSLDNILTLTIGINDESETRIYNYAVNDSNLIVNQKIYPFENDSTYFEVTILRMWTTN